MLTYKRILFATDLSKNAKQVAKQAKVIAENSKSTLYALHVLEHSPVAYAGEFTIPVEANLEQTLEANARKALHKLGKDFNIPEKNQLIETGSVKRAILEASKKLKIDLIIVGTHGHHGFDLLLGSHANAILHIAKCDVLVVNIK